jgi:hypothetical protein
VVFLTRAAFEVRCLSKQDTEPVDSELDSAADWIIRTRSNTLVLKALISLRCTSKTPLQHAALAHWIMERTAGNPRRHLDSLDFSSFLGNTIDYGFHDILVGLLTRGIPFDRTRALERAVRSSAFDSLSVVQTLLDKTGCAVTPRDLYGASNSGNLKVFKLVEEKLSCLFDHTSRLSDPEDGREDLFRWILVAVAVHGYLDILQHLYENKERFGYRDRAQPGEDDRATRTTFAYAVDLTMQEGRLDCARFLFSRGISCSSSAVLGAAQKGHLEVIRWVRS